MKRERLLEIYPEIKYVHDDDLRKGVEEAFLYAVDRWGWDDKGGLENCPVNMGTLPTDSKATNLEHMRSAASSCERVFNYLAPWMEKMGYKADHDKAIAGILLHDIGKLVEYDRDENNLACYSRTGPLFVHTVAGAYICKKMNLPDAVVHLVLTHSHSQAPEGHNAFETPEAAIVKGTDFASWSIVEHVYK